MHLCCDVFCFTSLAPPVITAIEPVPPVSREMRSNDSFIIPIGRSGSILSCSAEGSPRPDVKWVTAEGTALPDHVTAVTFPSGSHHTVTQLVWKQDAKASDTGVYKCVANNKAGNYSNIVNLNVGMNISYIVSIVIIITF